MASLIPPKMFMHASGQWCVKWGGRFRYLGIDRKQAETRYLAEVVAWTEWRRETSEQRSARRKAAPIVLDIVESFLRHKEATRGLANRNHYQTKLRRFTAIYARWRADTIRATHLAALKQDLLMAGKSVNTVNQEVVAIRAMLTWAMDMERIPSVRLGGVKLEPLGPPPDKSLSRFEVQRRIFTAKRWDVSCWLAMQYLTAMRPSEVVRMANGQGKFVEPWLYRMHGKTTFRTHDHRWVLVSDEARTWLKHLNPTWSVQHAYCNAVTHEGFAGGPHPMRHSAATHMQEHYGVERRVIDEILGHLPGRVSRTYTPIKWQGLLPSVSRLTLRGVW